MWNYRRFERKTLLGIRTGQNPLTGNLFRLKFTRSVFYILVTSAFLLTLVFFFFLYQNYSLFKSLSFEHAPDLLIYLRREQVWLTMALVSVASGLLAFVTLFVYRLSSSISGPLNLLHIRLKDLSSGKFFKPGIRTRESDEFQDLIETYNYFQKSLRLQTEKEISDLKTVLSNPRDKKSQDLLGKLIQQKQLQINGDVAVSEITHDSRHAS